MTIVSHPTLFLILVSSKTTLLFHIFFTDVPCEIIGDNNWSSSVLKSSRSLSPVILDIKKRRKDYLEDTSTLILNNTS